jgi:hypothetical protein
MADHGRAELADEEKLVALAVVDENADGVATFDDFANQGLLHPFNLESHLIDRKKSRVNPLSIGFPHFTHASH